MSERSKPFIPRALVIACTGLGIVASLTIGLLAFFFPARRIRRDYSLANCTVVLAELSCAKECRNLTVSSPAFSSTGTIIRRGRGNAPCSTVSECDERFECRYKATPNGIAIREDISAFPPGLLLFLILAGVLAGGLFLFLLHESLRQCGIDFFSDAAVRLVVFVPPGVDPLEIVRAIRSRWPRIEARSLSYRTFIEAEGRVMAGAKLAFETPAERVSSGLVFCVAADGRNDTAVLSAVPETFYRVLVLPLVDDCVHAACRGQGHVEGTVVNAVLARQVSTKEGYGYTVNETVETHEALLSMAALFDSVYSVGSWEFGNHAWIARRAVSPYIPLRIAVTSQWMRIRIASGKAYSRLFRFICCTGVGAARAQPSDEMT